MEQLHRTIEMYIDANIALTGEKYSFNLHYPRDFTVEGAPNLRDGDNRFFVFDVNVNASVAAGIGAGPKRRTGVVRVEVYNKNYVSKRNALQMLGMVTSFLERQSYAGVKFKDVTSAGDYQEGNWRVDAWNINFISTTTN